MIPSRQLAAQRGLYDRCRHPTGTHTPFRPEDVEQSVPARFAQQVRRHPGRVAVAAGAQTLTYAALDRAANRVAHAVIARSRPDSRPAQAPVALLFEHGSAAIVAMLGALKGGQCYVFLDPALPPARLAFLLDDAQAVMVVTNTRNLALARALVATEEDALDLDTLAPGVGEADPRRALGPDALFGLIYTSGSTGQPKAVVHDHRNMLSMVGVYADSMRLCPDDRLTLLASCSVNTAVLNILGALLNGAAVHPFDVRTEGVARLPAWLRREGITIYHSVPTLFRQLLDALAGEAPPPAMRVIYLGGEAVYRRDVERFRERFGPDCLLLHGLGCTELSLIRQFYIDRETPLGDRRIPVGYAKPDREVLILDEGGRPVAPGETGEIVLRSRYLALGYWRRPHLTRQAFLPDPAGGDLRSFRTGDLGFIESDGCLTHLGRQDFQVKIRGHRVELAEIELALLELAGVREAVVTAPDDPGRAPRLVAYVVPTTRAAPTVGALRAGLAARLPPHMIPAAFVTLDALPLTDTGKVDRLALPAPGRARPPLAHPRVAPQTPFERALAGIWAEVLGLDVDAVGIHDEFLALGGDSLLAAKILMRVEGLLNAELSPAAFFAAGTIAELAVVIVERHPLVTEALADVSPPDGVERRPDA